MPNWQITLILCSTRRWPDTARMPDTALLYILKITCEVYVTHIKVGSLTNRLTDTVNSLLFAWNTSKQTTQEDNTSSDTVKPWRWFVLIYSLLIVICVLCIVDYYSKFPFVNKAGGLSADDMIRAANSVFAEFALPQENSFRCRHELHITKT